ncbi:hypothetical protein FGRMN_7752 [Fusarium graminum]|nr:hypothetical protein FGRMN_7752 [Fusarium graminum]
MSSPEESKPCDQKAKEAEYQALWQCCDRASRKVPYLGVSDPETKRMVLDEACRDILEKRRELGKPMCGTSVEAMVDLHLQRELNARLLAGARLGLPSPSPNPIPMPYRANSNQFMASPVSMHANPNPYGAIPQQAQQPQLAHPQFDFMPHGADPGIRQELDSQRANIRRLINTLRAYDNRISQLDTMVHQLKGRVAQLERKRDIEQGHDRTRTVRYAPQPLFYGDSDYPIEGIEGSDEVASSRSRPLTPGSQTPFGRDEDEKCGAVCFPEAFIAQGGLG